MLSCEGAAVIMADRERRRGQRWPIIVLTGIVSAVLSPGAGAQIKQAVGSDVTLKAEYKGVPSEIIWKVNGNKVVKMELIPKLKTRFYRFKDRANISDTDGSLTIRNLQVGDSGEYKAEAMVENNIIEDTFISLTVIAQIKQAEGSDVTLKAEYKGVPSEINWNVNGNKVVEMELIPKLKTRFYRLGDRANISPTDGSLTIRNLQIGDSGLYKAEALVENSIAEDTFISLTVIACPTEPTISDHSTKDKIELSCESETSGVTYEWRKQTAKVGEGAIYTAPRPREDVTLTCLVYVDKDVCKDEASITVLYIPVQIIKPVRSEVTLESTFDGVPSEITWKKDHSKVVVMKHKSDIRFYQLKDRASINPANGDLTIKNLEVGDSGWYMAQAVVNHTYQERYFVLTVTASRRVLWS